EIAPPRGWALVPADAASRLARLPGRRHRGARLPPQIAAPDLPEIGCDLPGKWSAQPAPDAAGNKPQSAARSPCAARPPAPGATSAKSATAAPPTPPHDRAANRCDRD